MNSDRPLIESECVVPPPTRSWSTTALSWGMPRLQELLFIALFLVVVSLGPRLLNVDGDLGRHITVGNAILEDRSIPIRDIFSHSMEGEPLTPHEWLAQVIYALAYRGMGLDGVVILCGFLIAVTFILVYRQAYERSQLLFVSLGITLLGVAASSLHWLARPHLFTLLLMAVWVGELERIWQGKCNRWWVLPLIMLTWANLHGAFLAGFVVWGIYWTCAMLEHFISGSQSTGRGNQVLRSLSLGGGLALAVTLVNPVGWRLWETSLEFLRSEYLVSHTAEYLPPDFHSANAWPFLMMVIGSILLFGLSRRQTELPHLLIVASWTAMAIYSQRNIPLYAVVASPILAWVTANVVRESPRLNGWLRFDARLASTEASLRGGFWPVIVVLLVVVALFKGVNLDIALQGNRFDPTIFPVQAVDWMESQPIPGSGFNYFPWGGYLLFRRWPEEKVFIDGQTDFYGEQLTRQYEHVITLGIGWQDVLRQYGIRWVLMPPGSKLAKALLDEPGWRPAYQDRTAIYLRYEP